MKKYKRKIIPLGCIKFFTFKFIFCSIAFATDASNQEKTSDPFLRSETSHVTLNPEYFGPQEFALASEESPSITSKKEFINHYFSYIAMFSGLLVHMQNGLYSCDDFDNFNRAFMEFYHRYHQTVYRAYPTLSGEFEQEGDEVCEHFCQKVLVLHELFFQGGKKDEKFSIDTVEDARDLYIRLSDIIHQNL